MKKLSPAPCILSLVCGVIGIPLFMLWSGVSAALPNGNYGLFTDEGGFTAVSIIFFAITFILMAVAVVLGIISIKQKRPLKGFAIAGIITAPIVFLLPILFLGFLNLVFSV